MLVTKDDIFKNRCLAPMLKVGGCWWPKMTKAVTNIVSLSPTFVTNIVVPYVTNWLVASMLVTDVGDQMCWWQVWDVGDQSRHQHQEFGINVKNQSPTSYSGILWCWWRIGMSPTRRKMLPTSKNGHHHKVTSIKMSPTSVSPIGFVIHSRQSPRCLWSQNYRWKSGKNFWEAIFGKFW